MFNNLIDKIDQFWNNLLCSKYYFVWIPGIIAFFWFLETVGIFGFFIPMEIISITYFAFIHQKVYLFLFSALLFFLGVFWGLLVWYFIGRKFYRKILDKFIEKFPVLEEYFKEVDKYIDKYHLLAFPLLINLGFTRPIIGLHLGARKYNETKYILWTLLGSFFYVVPRVVIGYLVGVFGKIIIEKLKIGLDYVIWFALWLVFIFFVLDFIKEEKELKK